ncbi:MAG: pyrroline-5-carboxylate reductase [Clostridiales Family XIII bacterium]|jgi:pyrroline-5-carboxylate reductase|nr:pyrroline-5-carboxylate reductase [Clostridiales Family XIII bacterium]
MKIGFIGAGNMGGALAKGYASSLSADLSTGLIDSIIVYDADTDKVTALSALPAVQGASSLADLYAKADALVLCVKPQMIDILLDEIAWFAPDAGGKLVISIAAGVSIGHLQTRLGEGTKAVRVMPNTPAMLGAGMSALSEGAALSAADRETAETLFASVGKTVWVTEDLMDIVTGISGSSPAYAYMYIEGLINAGVAGGLTREAATLLAAQSTLGAARMALESGTDPLQLRLNVCSPGGTTIEAVKVLEEAGLTDIIEKAAAAAAVKSKTMTK